MPVNNSLVYESLVQDEKRSDPYGAVKVFIESLCFNRFAALIADAKSTKKLSFENDCKHISRNCRLLASTRGFLAKNLLIIDDLSLDAIFEVSFQVVGGFAAVNRQTSKQEDACKAPWGILNHHISFSRPGDLLL